MMDVQFNVNSKNFTPYIEHFKNDSIDFLAAIKNIVIGPHPDQGLREISIRKFIKSRELNAEIICSNIPYRE